MNVITKVTSGFPLFVVDSANGSGVNFQWNGNSLNRPNLVGDPNRGGAVAANPTCAAPRSGPHSGTLVQSLRLRSCPRWRTRQRSTSPSVWPEVRQLRFLRDQELSLSFREGMMVEFRAEFFNLFNHPQFFLTGGSSGMQDINASTSFGVINGTVNNPRVIQFALKLNF